MPTAEQLAHIDPVDGDGSSTVEENDGSTTVSWPDGTVRVNYTDGSSMVTFPDFAVLNIYADGTRDLADAAGNPLDLTTGQPLQPVGQGPAPESFGPDRVLRVLSGEEILGDLTDAKDAYETLETLEDAIKGEIDPVAIVEKLVEAILEVIKAIETEERGCRLRAWCYTVTYDALGMGAPPEPAFSGSQKGPDQDALDLQWWRDGVQSALDQLAAGDTGTALHNKVLLNVASHGGDPAAAVTTLWHAVCKGTNDKELAKAYESLDWPQPTGA